jgi:hypothetical protein
MAMQMTCPYCKREFPYDNGRIDAEISRNGQRIAEIIRRITAIKHMRHTPDTWKERRALVIEMTRLNERQSELKAVRKAADQQIKYHEHLIFRELVKERFGQAVYMELVEAARAELEAYRIGDTMKQGYSRSPHLSNVTSINKL